MQAKAKAGAHKEQTEKKTAEPVAPKAASAEALWLKLNYGATEAQLKMEMEMEVEELEL